MFSKPKKAIGLDIGTYAVKAVQMSRSGSRLFVEETGYAHVDRNQLNEDPVTAHAAAIHEALVSMQLPQSMIVAALPGQTAVIRYPRLANVGPEMMELTIEKEAGQSIPYDLDEVYLDWSVLSETEEGGQSQQKVLLVAAKNEVISSRLQVLEGAEIQCSVLGVDSLALADAAEACGYLREGETLALVNIGLTSVSIHFVKDGISNFIRDVNWGVRELIQSIAKERRIDPDQAAHELKRMGMEEPAPEPLPEAEPEEPQQPPAIGGQDSLDDPFGEGLGGGSLLDPLEDEYSAGGGLSGQAPKRPVEESQANIQDVVSSSLSRLVSEVRRSLDYYEHQLYERPVDRILLSGGLAPLPILASTLQAELGVEQVEVANPMESALILGDAVAMDPMQDAPASFMVAVGLAARGMADL